MLGYLATIGRWEMSDLRSAMARGTVMASFTIEGFSYEGLVKAKPSAVDQRLSALRNILTFN